MAVGRYSKKAEKKRATIIWNTYYMSTSNSSGGTYSKHSINDTTSQRGIRTSAVCKAPYQLADKTARRVRAVGSASFKVTDTGTNLKHRETSRIATIMSHSMPLSMTVSTDR